MGKKPVTLHWLCDISWTLWPIFKISFFKFSAKHQLKLWFSQSQFWSITNNNRNMATESKREAITELLKNNVPTSTIMKTLKVNKMFVWRCQKWLQETGGAHRRQGSGRPRTQRSRGLIKAVRSKVAPNPARSISNLAREYSVSRRTMGRVVKEDLGLYPYKLQRRQLLSSATKMKRMTRAKILKTWLAENPEVIIIYSNEKLFTVAHQFNLQNDRILSEDISKVDPSLKYVYRSQKPRSIRIWCAVASNGKKSPVFRIPHGVKMNQSVYLTFLKEKVLPWIKSEFPGKKSVSLRTQPLHMEPRLFRHGASRILTISRPKKCGPLLHQTSTPLTSLCRG